MLYFFQRGDYFMNKSVIIKDFIKQNGTKNKLGKGDYLEDDFENYLYLLEKGILYIYQDNIDGTTLIYKIISPNNLFFCDNNKYFRGKSEVVFYKIPIDTIRKNSSLFTQYTKLLTLENKKKDMFIRDMLTKDKVCRLLSIFVRLCNTFREIKDDVIIIKIKITQEELAHFCGTTRENVARIMKQLKEKNILDTSSHYLKILDLEKIKNIIPCEGCNGFICKTF
ncbi:Crp/Fnr family transcriptional regulator [Staphylococcus microti]|nr:Crp/Fnr family transcriptional regulator [Staphylococcus microti]